MFIVHRVLAALMEKIFTSESFTSRDGVLVISGRLFAALELNASLDEYWQS